MTVSMSTNTIRKPKRPIAKMGTVIGKLEALQFWVDDHAENHEINEVKERLMRLLSKWEAR